MAIYLEYDGIQGNVTAKGYSNHIALFSARLAIKRNISMEVGSMSNRETSCPKFSEITLSKAIDKSHTALFKESVVGCEGKTATIKFVRTGANNLQAFMVYELKNVMVSGYTIKALSSITPIEFISLSYSQLSIRYTSFNSNNSLAQPNAVGYNLATAKAL